VTEVLGSGDASRSNQRFALRRPPLTHVTGGAGGARSTLDLRVNDVLWDQVASLYPAGPRDQAYVVRIDDDQVATVVFGDGERGSRPGTGSENITATYRSGIGVAGQVPADSLTLLQTRPPGVRSVTNPVAASGAADPETLADARLNAPLTVLAMGRIVSLRDYEDFAAGFAGIGKAQAVEIREGERSLVHVTVAGSDGGPVSPSSELILALIDEVEAASDPTRRVQIDSFQLVYFHVSATIRVDPRHRAEAVIDAVRATLRATFSFARRAFGTPVTAAEVVTAIQAVAGVEAVDLDSLFRVDDAADPPPATLSTIISAERARAVGASVRPAQLLVINPFGIVISEAQPS
jgi:predicted phage baseplate assembly protein